MPRTKKIARPAKVEPQIELPPPQPPRHTGFWILLVVGLLLLAGSTYIAWGGTMTGWELKVFETINGVSLPDYYTNFAKALSNAVYGMFALIVVFLVFVPKFRFKAWQYAVAAGNYVVTLGIEHIVQRARPVLLTDDTILRASQGGHGFPSGHETVLAAVCITVWLFVSWPWRIFIILLLVAEGWARIFLGVHAPLDIVGGIAVAMVVVAILHLLPQKLRHTLRLM